MGLTQLYSISPRQEIESYVNLQIKFLSAWIICLNDQYTDPALSILLSLLPTFSFCPIRFSLFLPPSPPSVERSQVSLDLDGIVQVLDRHLHDSSTGMMTRISVLKWLYHLYIKTPRKVSISWYNLYHLRVSMSWYYFYYFRVSV